MHRPQRKRRYLRLSRLTLVVFFALESAGAIAGGQGYPGGGGQMPGRGSLSPSGSIDPSGEPPSAPAAEKPDKAAAKAFAAGMKSMSKAREYAEAAAKAPTADKKSVAMEKLGDAYDKALDQFTEVLRNKSDMYEAWSNVGDIHLRLGAYRESIDDYNHAIALKPDLLTAIEQRAEAYLAIDRLDQTQSTYMDLFNHARPLADRLMAVMQKWLDDHRAAPNGMRPADIDAFGKWLKDRDSIAKQTASAAATPGAEPPAH